MKDRNVVIKNYQVILNLIQDLQRLSLALINNMRGRCQIKFGMTSLSRAFTLIELLVVILIVAILAAIAVPQYQKAVWKARAVQLRVAVQALAQAQEQYYLIHGTYPTAFSQLDIAFDSFPEHPKGNGHAGNLTSSNDAIRRNEWAEIIINNTDVRDFKFSTGVFMQGKYDGEGFLYAHQDKENKVIPGFYCIGDHFCPQIMGLNTQHIYTYGTTFYPM